MVRRACACVVLAACGMVSVSCGEGVADAAASSGAAVERSEVRRLVSLPVEGVIGASVRVEDLRGVLAAVDEEIGGGEGLIVIKLDSPGGSLAHVPALVDFVEDELEPRGEVVLLVEEAFSAAALFGLSVERVVFEPTGVMGASYTMGTDPLTGDPVELTDEEQSVALAVGAECARRGDRAEALARAMQLPVGLWVDDLGVARTGAGDGERLAREGEFLVLTSLSARQAGVSLGESVDAIGVAELLGYELEGEPAGVVSEALTRMRADRERVVLGMSGLVRRAGRALEEAEGAGRGSVEAEVAGRLVDELGSTMAEEPEAAEYLGVDEAVVAGMRERLAAL